MIVDNAVLLKWYDRLSFPTAYDATFKTLLQEGGTELPETFGENPQSNLLLALYSCEELEADYTRRGIDGSVLLATLHDIVIWTDVWFGLKQELGLMETGWLCNHLQGKLFRLGRLQFCMGEATHDIPDAAIVKGDPVLEVHIPADGAMTDAACTDSIACARRFFATYFPDFHYRAFTCHSWLLDETLKQFLPAESNILKFQARFIPAHSDASDAMLKYIFRWDTTREMLPACEAHGRLATAVKTFVLNGGTVYETLGWFR